MCLPLKSKANGQKKKRFLIYIDISYYKLLQVTIVKLNTRKKVILRYLYSLLACTDLSYVPEGFLILKETILNLHQNSKEASTTVGFAQHFGFLSATYITSVAISHLRFKMHNTLSTLDLF